MASGDPTMILSTRTGGSGNNEYLIDITYKDSGNDPPLSSITKLEFHPPTNHPEEIITFDVGRVQDNFWYGQISNGIGSANILQSETTGTFTGSLTTSSFVYQFGSDADGNLRLNFRDSASFPED